MSVVTDTASKVHHKQLDAVTRSQELVTSALGRLVGAVSDLKAKVPGLPDAVSGPVQTVTSPVAKLVGTPQEARSLVLNSTRDWFEAQQRFQAGVLDVLTGNVKRSDGPEN